MPTDTTKTGEFLSEPISFREKKEEGEGRTGPDKTNGQGGQGHTCGKRMRYEIKSTVHKVLLRVYLCICVLRVVQKPNRQ